MPIETGPGARLHEWTQSVGASLRRLTDRGLRQLKLTVDAVQWRRAVTVRDRMAAVSWRRAGGLAATAVLLAAGIMGVHALTRPDAYPPPDPTERELALREATLRKGPVPPPASLVEANKSWKAE